MPLFWTRTPLHGPSGFPGFGVSGVGFGGVHGSAKSSLCLTRLAFFSAAGYDLSGC
jgi:hypothetical protein